MTETIEFETTYEELELIKDAVVGTMWLVSTDGEKRYEYMYYPPRFMPEDGRYLSAPYTIRVSVSDERMPVSPLVSPAVSIQKFEGRIIGFGGDVPAFELLDPETGNWVAQILLDPYHLPDWLSNEGDTCRIAVRLEYDRESVQDKYDEAELDEKRAQFQEQVAELEEYVA